MLKETQLTRTIGRHSIMQASSSLLFHPFDIFTGKKKASIGGHLEIIGLLILAEFDTCKEDSLGNLPIHYIASGGFEKCLKPLLRAGSRVRGQTQLCCLKRRGREEFVL